MRGDRIVCPTIDRFTGPYRFLSNFSPAPFHGREGYLWPTVEHFYQAQKTKDSLTRERIRLLTSPGQAKRKGNSVPLREDWEDIKLKVMRYAVKRKFEVNPQLAAKLISTFPYILIEGNHWHDEFWGIDMTTRIGHNFLGLVLMEVRAILRIERAWEEQVALRKGNGR